MALQLIDGFDAGDAAGKGWTGSTGLAFDTDTRVSYGRSMNFNSGSSSYRMKPLPSPASRIVAGFASKTTSITTAVAFMSLSGDNVTTHHVSIAMPSASTIGVYRGGSGGVLLGSANLPNSYQSWGNYFEIDATLSDTVGAVTLRVNGATLITVTNVDTKNAGTGTVFDTIVFWRVSTSSTWFDDVYVLDTTGSAPYNTFLGDVRVQTLVPTANGTYAQYTPSSGSNYQNVDELPYSAADYNTGATVGNRDTYTLSSLSVTPSAIYSVQNNVIGKKSDAGALNVKPIMRAGGTVYSGSTSALSTADVTYSDLRALNPNTGVAWTPSDLTTLEVGSEVA